MHLIRRMSQSKYGSLVIILGSAAVVVSILVTPTFAARYLSQDHRLTPGGIQQLNTYRSILSLTGILFIISGVILITVKDLGERIQSMNVIFDRLLESRVLKGILILCVLCFSLLRFVNLNADFPSGITQSSELYTDEGWYSTAAVRHVLTGNWHQPGEVNTAVAAPIGHVLHRISFALFGLGLSSARTTVAVSFILLLVYTALLVRGSFGNYAALLTALLLATNYLGFAYSRLATPYLVAASFLVAGILVAGGSTSGSTLSRILIASILVGAAILTHGSAILAIPLLAFLAWRSGTSLKERIFLLIASGLVLIVFVGGNRVITNKLFPEDYILYNSSTVDHIFITFHDWEWSLLHKLPVRIMGIGSGLVTLTLLFTTLSLAVSKRFRRDPLVHLLAGYIIMYIGMLSLNSFGPPRYYLSLLVPFSGLCAIACITLVDWLREKRWSAAAIIPIILVIGVSVGGGSQILTYLSKPSFSFYQMTHAVENIIQEREGTVLGVILFGDIADSVSLEIGTNAVNSLLIPSDVETKVRKLHPKYMIVHVSNIAEIAISQGGNVTELGAWDVFGNYYADHERVRLYWVEWPGESDLSRQQAPIQ